MGSRTSGKALICSCAIAFSSMGCVASQTPPAPESNSTEVQDASGVLDAGDARVAPPDSALVDAATSDVIDGGPEIDASQGGFRMFTTGPVGGAVTSRSRDYKLTISMGASGNSVISSSKDFRLKAGVVSSPNATGDAGR